MQHATPAALNGHAQRCPHNHRPSVHQAVYVVLGNPCGCLCLFPRFQAAYAYSVISTQAASAVMTAMDKLWVGQEAGQGQAGTGGGAVPLDPALTAGQQQQVVRLQVALESPDPDDVFVQVGGGGGLFMQGFGLGRGRAGVAVE